MVEIGHFALVLAFALALVQSVVPLVGARTGNGRMMAVGGPVAVTGFALVGARLRRADGRLCRAPTSRSLNVWRELAFAEAAALQDHRHLGQPRGLDAALGADPDLLRRAGRRSSARNLPATLRANVLAVQGWIGAAFLLFILATSNPFTRLTPAPIEGRDLNPVLQDIGLAIHPPLLYLGYVGFSICFSFAVAALIDGRIDAAWARWVRPWTLAAWIVPDRRHRDGLLLGLLRARLGRLLVLGPGRERLASCRGWPARRCCIRRSSWRSARR